jgi:hypothetical protein
MKIQDLTLDKVKDFANVLGGKLTIGEDGYRLVTTDHLEGVTVYSVHKDLTDVVKTLNMIAETARFEFNE